VKIFEGKLSGAQYKFAIILSRFNELIGNRLLEGALTCLKKHGYSEENIDLIKVPGAFEIPITAEKLAGQNKYNTIICLGAVIRGDTPHFEYVAGNTASGILQVSLKYKIPVIFGILTTDTYEQALERSALISDPEKDFVKSTGKETGSGNKGWDAAITAMEMADLMMKL